MFKLLFKNMKARQWVAVVFIFLLTLAQVYFMMTIVSYIGLLTAAVGAASTQGTTAVWLNGLGMIVCAVAMVVVDIPDRSRPLRDLRRVHAPARLAPETARVPGGQRPDLGGRTRQRAGAARDHAHLVAELRERLGSQPERAPGDRFSDGRRPCRERECRDPRSSQPA